MRRIFLFILSFAILTTPMLVLAASLGQPSGNDPGSIVPTSCDGPDCTWVHLIEMAQKVLNFIIFLGIIISALMFAYAGFLYMSAAGDKGKVASAHKIFGAVAIGILITLSAWLLVNTLLDALTGKGLKERQPNGYIAPIMQVV